VAALLATTYDWFQELIQAKELAQYFMIKGKPSIQYHTGCQLDVSPFVLRWIRSYLTDRLQKVV